CHHRHPDVARPPSPDWPGGAFVIRREVDPGPLRARYPQHFARFPRERTLWLLAAAAAVVVLLWGMADLGFFSGKLLGGGERLLEIAGLMLPPDPGSWAHARVFAVALLQTIAIAFLGTLGAAVLALPLALLAARNVTASRIVRFLSR